MSRVRLRALDLQTKDEGKNGELASPPPYLPSGDADLPKIEFPACL